MPLCSPVRGMPPLVCWRCSGFAFSSIIYNTYSCCRGLRHPPACMRIALGTSGFKATTRPREDVTVGRFRDSLAATLRYAMSAPVAPQPKRSRWWARQEQRHARADPSRKRQHGRKGRR